jgi:hypothetical protein
MYSASDLTVLSLLDRMDCLLKLDFLRTGLSYQRKPLNFLLSQQFRSISSLGGRLILPHPMLSGVRQDEWIISSALEFGWPRLFHVVGRKVGNGKKRKVRGIVLNWSRHCEWMKIIKKPAMSFFSDLKSLEVFDNYDGNSCDNGDCHQDCSSLQTSCSVNLSNLIWRLKQIFAVLEANSYGDALPGERLDLNYCRTNSLEQHFFYVTSKFGLPHLFFVSLPHYSLVRFTIFEFMSNYIYEIHL